MRRMLCILMCLLMVSVLPASSESSNTAGTVSDQIIAALASHGTAYFRIQSDFTFSSASGKESIRDFDSGTGSVTRDLENSEAENMLINQYSFISLRVENGVVSSDAAYLHCEASVLSDNSGVALRMYDDNGNGLKGVIIGDKLVADASYGLSSVVYHVGHTLVASGSFSVSLQQVQLSELPPKPVYIKSICENEDNSITITWDDPNPAEIVNSYAIYRQDITYDAYEKVDNVKDCNSWTDTSSYAKTIDLTALMYWIVVEGVNGNQSEISNAVDVMLITR